MHLKLLDELLMPWRVTILALALALAHAWIAVVSYRGARRAPEHRRRGLIIRPMIHTQLLLLLPLNQ